MTGIYFYVSHYEVDDINPIYLDEYTGTGRPNASSFAFEIENTGGKN